MRPTLHALLGSVVSLRVHLSTCAGSFPPTLHYHSSLLNYTDMCTLFIGCRVDFHPLLWWLTLLLLYPPPCHLIRVLHNLFVLVCFACLVRSSPLLLHLFLQAGLPLNTIQLTCPHVTCLLVTCRFIFPLLARLTHVTVCLITIY